MAITGSGGRSSASEHMRILVGKQPKKIPILLCASLRAPHSPLTSHRFSNLCAHPVCCQDSAATSVATFGQLSHRGLTSSSYPPLYVHCATTFLPSLRLSVPSSNNAPLRSKPDKSTPDFTSPHHVSPFLVARLVSVYSRFGLLADALLTFDAVSCHHATSSLLWNSILRATLTHGRPRDALSLYLRMRSMGAIPDGFTFPLAIRACATLRNPGPCLSIHNHATSMGFQSHLHVANELMLMYGNISQMEMARKVFDEMTTRNVVSWNTLFSSYSANCDCEAGRGSFQRMISAGTPYPNPVTWTALLSAHARCRRHALVIALFDQMRTQGVKATAEAVAVALSACPYVSTDALRKGKAIHCFAISSGFVGFPFVSNSPACMYGKLGDGDDAKKMFHGMEARNLVSWNSLVSSYAAGGFCNEAYEIFLEMEKAGDIAPNVVSWSAVVGGFASCGMMERSLQVFRQMQEVGVWPNSITIATVLSACAQLSALRLGREVHAHIIKSFTHDNLLVGNAALNMYAKSGCPNDGLKVFDTIQNKDLISWNSLIAGYGMHGLCDEALETFDDMISAGCRPDGITFISLLSACGHGGRVSEGRSLFDQMVPEHGISPSMEHYSCMVDLLGRAGLLGEARELTAKMPMEPNACVWGALLNSCRIHGNILVSEEAGAQVLAPEGQSPGNYMLLSNLYAACGRWKDSARVRVMTKAQGLKKNPGQSWIEVKNKVHVFSAECVLPTGAVFAVLEYLHQEVESEESEGGNSWRMFE